MTSAFDSGALEFADTVETVHSGPTDRTVPGLASASAIDTVLAQREGFGGLRTHTR